jgi:hypothetical protein
MSYQKQSIMKIKTLKLLGRAKLPFPKTKSFNNMLF